MVMRIQRDRQESGAGTWAPPTHIHTHTGAAPETFFSTETDSGDPLSAAHSP